VTRLEDVSKVRHRNSLVWRCALPKLLSSLVIRARAAFCPRSACVRASTCDSRPTAFSIATTSCHGSLTDQHSNGSAILTLGIRLTCPPPRICPVREG
jgi:hypothetical protein